MMSRSGTAALTALAVWWAASNASAQEMIFDPENPAFSEDGAETPGSTDDGPDAADAPDIPAAEDEGEETIFDPENPAMESSAPQGFDASALDEPDSPSGSGDLKRVRFLGGWSSMLRLDTHWSEPSSGSGEDIVEVTSDFRLRLEWDASESMRVVVGADIRHWMAGKENQNETDLLVNASDPRADVDLRLGEAYVLGRSGSWSLAAGNMITRWGATDLTRPGDVVNPVDLTQLDGARAGQRLPQPTVDLTYSGTSWSWQGLLVPFFVANDAWLIGRDSALLNPGNSLIRDQFPISDLVGSVLDPSVLDEAQPLLQATRVPDELPGNVSLGTRFTATAANTDFGLGYFFGWDRQAFFEIDPDLRTLLVEVSTDEAFLDDLDALSFFLRNQDARAAIDGITDKAQAGETLFVSDIRRLHTLTLDVARYVGPIGVRADVAFQPEKTYFTESFESVRRPTLSAALGLSWENIESESDFFTVTVEGFVTRPFGADDGITRFFVNSDVRGRADDTILVYDDVAAGAAFAVVWMVPYIDTRLQIAGLSDFTQPDLVGSVQLTRSLTEGLDLTLGGVLFEGPPLEEKFSVGGVYDNNDAVFLQVSGLL